MRAQGEYSNGRKTTENGVFYGSFTPTEVVLGGGGGGGGGGRRREAVVWMSCLFKRNIRRWDLFSVTQLRSVTKQIQ